MSAVGDKQANEQINSLTADVVRLTEERESLTRRVNDLRTALNRALATSGSVADGLIGALAADDKAGAS